VSISVMDRVWRFSKARKGELLIMLAIADFANDAGEAWPSVPTLASKSRLSERQAQYALRRLVGSGELKIYKNKGPRGCHVYHVTISDTDPGAESAPVQKLRGAISDTRGAISGTLGVQYPAPEPSVNRHKNRHVQQEVDSDFIAQQQVFFPHLSVEQELGKAKAWLSTHPRRRMTRKFFVGWLKRIQAPSATPAREEW
jgi:hypothetical protein